MLWDNLPRLVLLAMILLVIALMVQIKKQGTNLAEQKARELKEEKTPVNAVVLPLRPTTITDRINLPGTILPWTDLHLKAKVAGTVTKVLVKEGDHIQAGAPLAQIEKNDYRIAADRAKAAWELAQAEYNRDRKIFKKGVIPAASLDNKKTAMQTAKADYDSARLQLSRTTITAPIDGVIQHLSAKVGLRLGTGDDIARILKIDKMKGVVGIPESDIAAVRKLDSVEILIQALADRKVTGHKLFLSPAPDSAARTYRLELAIDNPQEEILSGMFLRADIIKGRREKALVLPLYSVLTRNGEQFVFVEKDGKAVKKAVTLGVMEGWQVEAVSGLSPGDNLLVEGHRDVEDGQKIKVISTIDDLKGLLQ